MKTKALIYLFLFVVLTTTAKAQLTGEWKCDDGVCVRIRQIDNQIFWSSDDRPRVINVFIGYLAGNTITGMWADLPGGNIVGSGTLALRVESQNRLVKIDQTGDYRGSVWTKGSCQTPVTNQPPSRPDLSGTWYDYSSISGYTGVVSKISQVGDKLVFINNLNNQSSGYFLDNTSVIATDWEGGLKASLEDGGRKIVWSNGSVWQRSKR